LLDNIPVVCSDDCFDSHLLIVLQHPANSLIYPWLYSWERCD